MKLNIDVDPENKEEIRKAISLLEQFLDEKPKQEVEEQPVMQEPEQDNSDFIGQNNTVQQPVPQQSNMGNSSQAETQSNTQSNPQTVPNQTNPQTTPSQNQEPAKASEEENYGQAAGAIMGMFNSDVPSNMPLKDLQNQSDDSDDDEDMDNDLGLDIVPY